jgi:lipid-A-disaccharide synthase
MLPPLSIAPRTRFVARHGSRYVSLSDRRLFKIEPLLTDRDPSKPLVFIIAGEASGDNIAAKLMAALRTKTAGNVHFAGVGGEAMAAQGLTSLFPMRDLSLMGMAEILPHLPRLIRRLRSTIKAIKGLAPAVVVTVDSPGFCFRVAKRIRHLNIPVVHYVAPQLWAWRPQRGHELPGMINHLLALLPFEPAFFETYGVPCTFVGHPAVDAGLADGDGPKFRAQHGIADIAPVITVLPGSRRTEVRRLLPVFGRALDILAARNPQIHAVIPTVEAVADSVRLGVAQWKVSASIITDRAEKIDAFAASIAAITKSGTVTLELALAGVPMVVSYKVNPLTALVVRRMLRVDDVALVNLLAGERLVPEFLQERCTPQALAAAVSELLEQTEKRQAQRAGLAAVVDQLGGGSPGPSERAADVVISWIGRGSSRHNTAGG